jgi:NADH-quinone oxidoreductase subunit L
MTIPLVVLAVFAIVLGFLGTPYWPWLQDKLSPGLEHEPATYGLMGLSILLVAVGIGAGWAIYGRKPRARAESPDPLAARQPALFAALANRLGFDELYAATFGRLSSGLAAFADFLDYHVWGGFIRLLALLGEFTGLVSRENDEGALNGGFDATSHKLRATGQVYSRAQTGDAHGYLRGIALGFVLLLLLVILGGVR